MTTPSTASCLQILGALSKDPNFRKGSNGQQQGGSRPNSAGDNVSINGSTCHYTFLSRKLILVSVAFISSVSIGPSCAGERRPECEAR
jgi:hypothetical protein